MTLTVYNARIEVFRPPNDSNEPDAVVKSGIDDAGAEGDLKSVKITSRLNDAQDKATIQFENPTGRYTDDITIGDRLVFRALDETDDTQDYGTGDYGRGPYGGLIRRWTGLIGPGRKLSLDGAKRASMAIESEDFVFGILSNRLMYNRFEDQPISGSPDAILNRVLTERAPEIDLQRVRDVGITTTIERNGENLADVLVTLARRGEAVAFSRDDQLVFIPAYELGPVWDGPLEADDYYLMERDETANELINDIRIDGARDDARDQLAIQPLVESFVRIDTTNRVMTQLETQSNRLSQLEIYTRKVVDSEDQLVVRIHPNKNGAPTNADRLELDTYRRTLSHEFLSTNDWTTFLFGDDVMASTNPWLIIQTDGEVGHDIGVRTVDGVPAYRGWFPYRIAVRDEDAASIASYRRRQGRVKEHTLSSYREARDMAEERLRLDSLPRGPIQFEARSRRAHALNTGDVIQIEEPYIGAAGDYIVSEVEQTYQNHQLKTDISAESVASFSS